MDPYIEVFSTTGHHRNCNLLRYVPENRSSQRVVTGKLLFKNYKLTMWLKIKPEPIHKSTRRAMYV
jgi:hypothetical protein